MGIPVLAIARTQRPKTRYESQSIAADVAEVAETLGVKLVSRRDIQDRALAGVI